MTTTETVTGAEEQTATEVPVISTLWRTVPEAAAYSRRGQQTVYRALRLYRATRGRRGLRGGQEGPGCSWRIYQPDIDAWLAGDPPKRRTPSSGRAS